MERYGYCAFCRRRYQKNSRAKRQLYCGRKACQRARKRRWQRHKMATDPDYRLNQIDCMLRWRKRHPHYWQHNRKSHRSYTRHNRLLQKVRNLNRFTPLLIAKMDPITTTPCGTYNLDQLAVQYLVSSDTFVLIKNQLVYRNAKGAGDIFDHFQNW